MKNSYVQIDNKRQSIPLHSHMEPSEVLNLTHMMSLGEPDTSSINKHDILSAMSFDARGNYLAVGDYGGRCIIFERNQSEGKDDFEYITEF